MKFSKLLLVPLLALGLVGCATTDSPATGSQTASVPEGPAWAKADADKIKAALGGNLIPFLDYENGVLAIEEIPEAQGGGKLVTYTITNPKEGDRVSIVDKFVADGYLIEEPEASLPLGARPAAAAEDEPIEVYAYKLLEKKHLNEFLGLYVGEMTASNGSKVLTTEVFYNCDEEVNVWPAEEIKALSELNMVEGYIPEPEFEFTHIANLIGEEGEGFFAYAIYFGDNAENYAHTLAKNGYEVTIEADEVVPETEGEALPAEEPAEYEYTYCGHNDLFATDVYVYYEASLDATFLEITMGARQQWHSKEMNKMAEKAGIIGLNLPKPYMPLYTYEFGLTLKGETPEEGYEFNILGLTLDAKGPELYINQLLDAGYVLLEEPELVEEAIVVQMAGLRSLAFLTLSMEEIPELGAIMFTLTAELLPEAALTAEEIAYANKIISENLSLEGALPTLPGKFRFNDIEITDDYGDPLTNRYEEPCVYFNLYNYEASTNVTAIAQALVAAGYVQQGEDSLIYVLPSTKARIEIATYTREPTLVRLIVSKIPTLSSWKEVLTEADYARLVALVGGEDKLSNFPYVTDFEEKDSYFNAEADATCMAAMYDANKVTDKDLTAYKAALVSAGWTLTQDKDDNFELPLYTKTIDGVKYGICAGFLETVNRSCYAIYKLAEAPAE